MAERFWAPGELQTHVFEEPEMLVDPIIPWGGSFMIHGPRAGGKTQVALALATAVANGEWWFDRWATRKARVLFIENDTMAHTLQERLQAAAARINGGPIAFDTFSSAFNIVIATPSRLVAARDFQPNLVIVDTLRQSHILDENDSNTPRMVYGGWRDNFPDATMGYIHHDRKLFVGPSGSGDMDEAFRGSGAWLDGVDTGIHITRNKKSRLEHQCLMTFSKVRTCEQPPPLGLRLHEDTHWPEPMDPTPAMKLRAHLEATPVARTYKNATAWLRAQGIARTTAHRLATDAGLINETP